MRAGDSALQRSSETELRLPSEFAREAKERPLLHNRMQTLLQLLDEFHQAAKRAPVRSVATEHPGADAFLYRMRWLSPLLVDLARPRLDR